MKVALVCSNLGSRAGAPERRVAQLASGLAARGADVEIFTQSVAPGLWERLRRTASKFDLLDIHSAYPPLALAAARAGFPCTVFTPHGPIDHLARWPNGRVTRSLIDRVNQIVCTSGSDRDALCKLFPRAAGRSAVVHGGVDAEAIRAAEPYPMPTRVVLATGTMRASGPYRRAIAAMAGVDSSFTLVITGDGWLRRRLEGYAWDLRVSDRVRFVGQLDEGDRHRWLRTAAVVLACAEEGSSGRRMVEGLVAGAAVVASDLPIHRETAGRAGGRAVFIPPTCSPLHLADAIPEAVRRPAPPTNWPVTSWRATVSSTWAVYAQLISGPSGPAGVAGRPTPPLELRSRTGSTDGLIASA